MIGLYKKKFTTGFDEKTSKAHPHSYSGVFLFMGALKKEFMGRHFRARNPIESDPCAFWFRRLSISPLFAVLGLEIKLYPASSVKQIFPQERAQKEESCVGRKGYNVIFAARDEISNLEVWSKDNSKTMFEFENKARKKNEKK